MRGVIDQDARLRALAPDESFIVQAPAGSGKTELLTQRVLALLGTVRKPEEILAITFTRKAAAEMRHRLLQALAAAAGPPPEPEHERRTWELARQVLDRDRERDWNLATTPGRLAIQTIDSFNAHLARRMPWLTRFGGMPKMADDPARLYRQAARNTLDRVASGDKGSRAAARLLTHLDNQMERLQEMLVAMLQRRDQWLRHLAGKDLAGAREGLENALAGYVRASLRRCRDHIPAELWPEVADSGRYAAGNVCGDRPLAGLEKLRSLPGAECEDLEVWLGLADLLLKKDGGLRRRIDKNCGFPAARSGPAAERKAAMQRLLEEPAMSRWAPLLADLRQLPALRYGDEQWDVLAALTELLKLCVAELWVVFAERGEADFSEVALRGLEALGSQDQPSELLLRLDAALSHILVDEFQDTSHLQFALLERLTAGWQPGDGRTLFLVGDPMQSIYRFREAEVGLFLRAWREGLGELRPKPLVLQANFRSRGGVVNWVNRSFTKIFPGEEDPARGAVPYAPATAVHGSDLAPAVTVLARGGRDDQEEARQVRELVEQALARGDEKVAVLVRARTHLQAILPELRSRGLQYLARDVDLLAERPVARDLVSLTRAILHGGDRLSWLSVLRAPWCGLLLEDLHALCGASSQRTVPGLLGDGEILGRLSADGRDRAQRTFGVLQRGRAQRGRLGLRRLVEGCWLALGGPACCDAGALDDAGRVFDLLQAVEGGGDLESLESLEEGLQRLFAAPDAAADGRLQVMTIHRAKGLEFDTVILPGLGLRSGQNESPLLRWQELASGELLLAPIASRDGSRDSIYDAIGRLEKDKELLETVRLLYVAATRSRRRLYLLGHAERSPDGEWRAPAGSLLDVLWPAVEDSFQGLGQPEELTGDRPVPAPPSVRRVPVDWRAPELSAAVPAATGTGRKSSPSAVEETADPRTGFAARQAGTVLHQLLERIAREGLETWTARGVAGSEGETRARLRREGLAGTDLAIALDKVQRGVASAMEGTIGRWVLARRDEESVELAISSEEVSMGVVDRTFVDTEGVRWIIDYKTSEPHRDESLEEFYRREGERYRSQLLRYAELLAAFEPGRPVRAGLYFPLFDGWVELGDVQGQNISQASRGNSRKV